MSTHLSLDINTTNNNNKINSNKNQNNKNIDNSTDSMNPSEDNNNTEQTLSLNMEFTDDEYYKPINGSSQQNDNSSLDSMDQISKMRYNSEKQTSIEKIVNDVLIPPLSESSLDFNIYTHSF